MTGVRPPLCPSSFQTRDHSGSRANRGLGLELVRCFERSAYHVIACVRSEDSAKELRRISAVEIRSLDVRDSAQVESLAGSLQDRTIDILSNNAGVGSEGPSLFDLDPDSFLNDFDTNCLGALRMTQALSSLMRASSNPRIVNVSSILASHALNKDSRWYSYRASKAALNIVTQNLAFDLRQEGICCVALHPGWVRTDIGGQEAPLSPEESAHKVLAVVEGLSKPDTGRFLDMNGSDLPW